MGKFKSIGKQPKPKEPKNKLSKEPSLWEKRKYLDPFYYVDKYVMPKVKEKTNSKYAEGLVNLIFAGIFAAVIYFILSILFGSATPLVIVYSESMEPSFFRGDVMALSGANTKNVFTQEITLNRSLYETPTSVYATPSYSNGKLDSIKFENGQEIKINKEGDVVVYQAYPSGLPIIHRSIVKINATDGIFLLTKGDNDLTNPTFDQDCGRIILNNPEKNCISFYATKVDSLQGKSFFKIPFAGCVKLWLIDDIFSLVTTGSLPSNFNGVC